MTSTYSQLVKDLRLGKYDGEEPVREMLFRRYGVVTTNVGDKKRAWDLEVVALDGKQIGLADDTYDSDKMLAKFIKQFGELIEVKRDATGDRTGNLYWECWSNKRVNNPGCMLTCKADTIVFVRKKEFVFLKRSIFLSWIMDNLFNRTELSDNWRKKTFRGGKKQMMSARNNPDVRGILIPVGDIIDSPACFHVEPR